MLNQQLTLTGCLIALDQGIYTWCHDSVLQVLVCNFKKDLPPFYKTYWPHSLGNEIVTDNPIIIMPQPYTHLWDVYVCLLCFIISSVVIILFWKAIQSQYFLETLQNCVEILHQHTVVLLEVAYLYLWNDFNASLTWNY